MLAPAHYSLDEIVALVRAYINYEKFEELMCVVLHTSQRYIKNHFFYLTLNKI